MPLVNALQHNSPEIFNQQAGGSRNRFMKIRSLWSFPVKGDRSTDDADAADSEQPSSELGDPDMPSSFVT